MPRGVRPQLFIYQSFIAAVQYLLRLPLGRDILMSNNTPAALASEPAESVAEQQSPTREWAETALTVLFTAAAVLFVSFLAVVAGLV
jgi:hypothetical protein